MENVSVAVDAKTLLAMINPRIAELRRWLGDDHGDEAVWAARRVTAPEAQAERQFLRVAAHLLHVERAHRRGRVHAFKTLDEQATWLATMEHRSCGNVTRAVGLPSGATLAKLRAGAVLL